MPTLDEIADTAARCVARHATELGRGPLLVACSGGADSTALALVLATLRDADRLPRRDLALLHLDHGQHPLRRAAARAVRTLARRLGCGLHERRLPLAPGASEHAMRAARYAAFAEVAAAAGAAAIATAHHRDDHVETVLMRALRGTRNRGLAGIPEWRSLGRDLAVIRPLLETHRDDLRAVVAAAGVRFVEDPTNADVSRARSAVRHVILPSLRRGGNPDDSLAALAARARRDAARAHAGARAWISRHVRSPAAWRVDLPIPVELAPDAREEVFRLLHVALRNTAPLGTWLCRTLALLDAGTGTRVDAGLFAERTHAGILLVDRARAGQPPDAPAPLPLLDADVRFGATEWTLRTTRCDTALPPRDPTRTRAVIDTSRVALPLVARPVRPGDRLDLAGQPRPVSLRDAMQRRRVPRYDRDRIPVVVDAEGRPVWAPGLDVAAFAHVRDDRAPRIAIEHVSSPGGITIPESSY